MLRDGSDTDNSFSDDEDAVSGGGGEAKEEATFIPLPPDAPTISTSSDPAKPSEEGTDGQSEEDKGDPEMAPVYLKRLLPVFAELFHSSLAPIVRSEVRLSGQRSSTSHRFPGHTTTLHTVLQVVYLLLTPYLCLDIAGRRLCVSCARCVAMCPQSGCVNCVRRRETHSDHPSLLRSARSWLSSWKMRCTIYYTKHNDTR